MENPLSGLPHREPFVFIDAVVATEPGQSAHCSKTFPASEPFFRGHFPGNPIVPGVILTEALAQTAGLAAAAGQPGTQLLLSSIRGMKFPRAARPDEPIDLHATSAGCMGNLHRFDVRASVGPNPVAEGQIILSSPAS